VKYVEPDLVASPALFVRRLYAHPV